MSRWILSCLHRPGEVCMRQKLPDVMNQIGEGRVRQRAEGLVHRPPFTQKNVLRKLK